MSARLDPATPAQAGTVKANLVALGVAEGVARLAQLVTIALLGRVLGPEGLAVVGVAWAVYQLALPFVQYAPELMGARDVARGEATEDVLIELTGVKLALALVASVLIAIAAVTAFTGDPVTRLQVLAQGPLLIAVALNGVWAFRGLRRFSHYAIVRSLSSLLLLVLLAAFLRLNPVPAVVPAAEALAALFAAILAFGLLLGWRSIAATHRHVLSSFRGVRTRIVDTVQFGLGSFFAGAIWSVPLLVARVFVDPVEQGHLAACLRLMLAVNALFQLGLQVFHPVLAHRYAVDRAAGRFLAGALVMYALAATIPVSAGLIVAAPWIIPPLLGDEFTDAAPVFAALATSLMPTIVGSVFGYALMADGRYRLYNLICGGGAVLSAISCAVAFHIYPDAEAAVALTLTVAVVGAAAGIAAWRFDLVQLGAISWRQLAPSRIRKILQER